MAEMLERQVFRRALEEVVEEFHHPMAVMLVSRIGASLEAMSDIEVKNFAGRICSLADALRAPAQANGQGGVRGTNGVRKDDLSTLPASAQTIRSGA